MSSIVLTFTNINAPKPFNYGSIIVNYNDGNTNIALILRLNAISSTGRTKWVEDSTDGTNGRNYVASFNRDFRNIGGALNLLANVTDDNVVTITSKKGTFISATKFSDLLELSFTTNNVLPVTEVNLTISRSPTIGDCSTIQYTARATDGFAPFTLINTRDRSNPLITSWDGTLFTFDLPRGSVIMLELYDARSELASRPTLNVPRQILEGDFDINITSYIGSSDLLIVQNTVIASISPLEYSLDNITESSGNNYQLTNSFAGIFDGEYKVFIKDVYGCEISKIISLKYLQNVIGQSKRYFQIMEGQSIIFNEFVEFDSQLKKNYFNTGSYNEAVQGQIYNAKHFFSKEDGFKGIQFKSSYPYHSITLHHKNGSMVDIPPIMISENLGVLEKMDVFRFPLPNDNTKTGVYFNGGNTYIPNTSTIIGTNEFVGITPVWAKVGQVIFLNNAKFTIIGTGYDDLYGWYFIVDAVTGIASSATVQLTYNKQEYNTFEFYIDTSIIENCDVIVVEKGFGIDLFDGNPWVSERIYPLVDNDEYLLIKWSDIKNKADIVFQSGIQFMTRLKGEFIPNTDDSSETYSGDSNEYSIEQIRRLNFDVIIEGISFKQVMQLNIASALSGFFVNGLNLVCKSTPEKSRLDKSNLWVWRGQFSYGQNIVALQQDETVLSVSTGVVGGGGTGIPQAIDISGVTLFKNDSGNLVIYEKNILLKQ